MSVKNSLITTGLITSLFFAGCGPKPLTRGYRDDTPDEITRLIEKNYKHSIYAVGTADGPNENIARNKAVMHARAELSRQFKSEVSAIQKSYQEATNNHPSDQYSQVMEIFSSMELQGSTIAKSMISRHSAQDYHAKVLVVISAEKLKSLLDEKAHAYTSFRAMKAYKKLQERVAKEKESSEFDSN